MTDEPPGQENNTPAVPLIPASSRAQAMDWSLVLISQGVESQIVRREDNAGWGLLVTPEWHQKSLEIIQQYRLENRGWALRHRVFRTGLVFDWTAIAWVALLLFFFWLDLRLNLKPIGMANVSALQHGQWWRLFTAIWLHADVSHLTANAGIGFLFLALAMGRYGAGPGLLAAYLAGAGANLLRSVVALEDSSSLGASGMVMGALGLIVTQSFWLGRKWPRLRSYAAGSIVAGLMMFVLYGLSPGSDVVAHFGGFALGIVAGMILSKAPVAAAKPLANWLGGGMFAVLVIVPWLLAMRFARPG